jgi:hypothetical protein
MDPQVPASFIPKKPLTSENRSSGGGGGLINIIALLIFVASLAGAGGTFLYQQYLKNSITAKADSLNRAQGAYDPGVIQDLVRLDSRIAQARTLMGKHVAPTALFAYLAGATLESVQFSSFNYALEADGGATISLSGVARSFSSVALQSDSFGSSRVLRNVVFSDISVGQTGSVTFSVSATVDPALLLYDRALVQTTPVAPTN